MTTPQEYDLSFQAEKEIADRIFGQKALKELSIRNYEINKIAKNLFMISFSDFDRDEAFFSDANTKEIAESFRNKAEKIYEATSSYEDACRFINVIYAILPKSIKSIVDSL
jgi:hypothetical protein